MSDTVSGLPQDEEHALEALVVDIIHEASRAALATICAGGVPTATAMIVLARVMLFNVATGFFACARGDVSKREMIHGAVGAIWRSALDEAVSTVRAVDDRQVEAELAVQAKRN